MTLSIWRMRGKRWTSKERQRRRGEWTGPEAAAHFDQVARTHGLRETGHYDPRLVDMLIAGVRAARPIPLERGMK
jgi:hypothetical protein